VFVLAIVLACSIALAAQGRAQTGVIRIAEGEKGDGGYWKTTFGVNPPKQLSPAHAAVRDRMMKRKVLEEYVQFLSPVRWPHALDLFASDCAGNPGDSPYYVPRYYFINMCYSMIAAAESIADYLVDQQNKKKLWTPVSREALIAGMYASALLHETGHAAFDIMEVPVFGREEDAADQMAGFIALQFGKDNARTLIKGFAYLWAVENDPPLNKPNTRDPKYPKDPTQQCYLDPFCAYSDEHGTSSQRMYNTLCIAYGGEPDWFKDFVESRWLPQDRSEKCPAEYQRIKKAFQATIWPFIDLEQMKKVQAKSWFTGQELKER
jgi:hypothetical protein